MERGTQVNRVAMSHASAESGQYFEPSARETREDVSADLSVEKRDGSGTLSAAGGNRASAVLDGFPY